MRMLLTPLLLLFAWGPPAQARTWHVLNDGTGDASTVQAGIDSAAFGDTVLVGPGTYMENLSIVNKDLVLKSGMGPEITTLDGSSQFETVIYMENRTRMTVVEGFTITGGMAHYGGIREGGGGLFLFESSPIIRGNCIVGNGTSDATRFGGGIYAFFEPTPLIEGNLFQDNSAELGGAITVGGANPEIRGNVFRENSCPLDGGAI